MPTLSALTPRTAGATLYMVCEVQGRPCLAPRSQPANLALTFRVKLDPASGQEFYVNVLTKAKSWELPDPDAEAQTESSRAETEESHTPPATVTCLRTVYELVQSEQGEEYVPQNLPFEPLHIQCWRPIYNAMKNRFLYINCETNEQVIRLPPIWDYCDDVRQFYEHYNIGSSYVDALQDYRGKEEELLNTLSIQYGPKPPTESEVMEITEMYLRQHDMSMLSEIDNLLMQWRGNEIGLLQELQKEYGGRRPRTVRERVRAIYAQYQPSKILSCEELLDQYKGREAELFLAVEEKFGPEFIKESDSLEQIIHRIRCQFIKYDTKHSFDVDTVLMRHKGAELQLLELLVFYYGPEVDPEEMQELDNLQNLTVTQEQDNIWDETNPLSDNDEKKTIIEEETEIKAKENNTENNLYNEEAHQNERYEGTNSNNTLYPCKIVAEEYFPEMPLITSEQTILQEEELHSDRDTTKESTCPTVTNDELVERPKESNNDDDNDNKKEITCISVPRSATPSSKPQELEEVCVTGEVTPPSELGHTVITPVQQEVRVTPAMSEVLPPTVESQRISSPLLFPFPSTESLALGRTEMLGIERVLREREFQKQQQRILIEEKILEKELDTHRRLLALETEKRWEEETEKVMEVARSAAVHTVQEITRLQHLRDEESRNKEKDETLIRHEEHRHLVEVVNSSNKVLMVQLSQMEKQLKDVFSTVETFTQKNEKLQSENAQLLNKFADMRHQYDLELQGMRIHLNDMRVHVATMMNEHDVKTLHLKKQQETTVSNMERELERERENASKVRRTYEEMIAEKEKNITKLQKELNMVITERDNAEEKINLQNVTLRERMTELEELYNSIEMKRSQRREVASQTVEEFQDNMKPQEIHFSEKSEQSYGQVVLSSTHHNHLDTVPSAELIRLQEDYRESEQNVAKLCVVRDELMTECDKAHYVIKILRQRVEMLETSMEKLQLRELAVPDIPLCIGDQDVAMQNLKEELDKAQNRLTQAQAESSMLKREIRDLRSLLAVYMSNSKKP